MKYGFVYNLIKERDLLQAKVQELEGEYAASEARMGEAQKRIVELEEEVKHFQTLYKKTYNEWKQCLIKEGIVVEKQQPKPEAEGKK